MNKIQIALENYLSCIRNIATHLLQTENFIKSLTTSSEDLVVIENEDEFNNHIEIYKNNSVKLLIMEADKSTLLAEGRRAYRMLTNEISANLYELHLKFELFNAPFIILYTGSDQDDLCVFTYTNWVNNPDAIDCVYLFNPLDSESFNRYFERLVAFIEANFPNQAILPAMAA